ncbi:MAG: chromosome segregation protein SMC [Eubacterium sp.]|nr:chromosome segregation protein SMC [Eubacterium sp.]
MYLKNIEMQGFKSFANKINLEFHDGITGIVGPNGSGKSNVADAVRWVLGEQSAKQLRGGNMQDVIFSGTESRKPLGFASVAITFDNSDRALNCDVPEVTVSRRLYRSGESEYKLNGKTCRLRDINEMFFDTGIGKEGYSIIGQGQIDKILSGKPDDRRELFDEAAGIVKFKRRKAASVKKLESEEQNLVRVTDLLTELTRQKGPLEKQATTAEEYLRLRDEMRGVDITLFCRDSLRIENQITEAEQNLTIADAHQQRITEEFERTRQEYDRIEAELEALDLAMQEVRDQNAGRQLEKQQVENEITLLQEQIRASWKNHALYQERMDAIDADVGRRQENSLTYEEEKAHLEQERESLRERRDAGASELEVLRDEIAHTSRGSEENRSETIALLNKRTSIRERMQRYDTMLEQIEIRKAEINSEQLRQKTEAAHQKEVLETLQKERQALDDAVQQHESDLKDAEDSLVQMNQALDEMNRQMEIGQSAWHRENSRLESLRNIAERYEGYGGSIKRVMSQKEDNPGIHGVVAELINTEQAYETAIETALGGSLQNIVTDNENTAKYLIEYLKKGHYGRATFLPLTAVRKGRVFDNENVLVEKGVIGLASSLVECDRIYNGIVESLLGRTVVVDQIDHAIAIGRKYHHTIRMVTLEGELLNPGGSMTGGAFRSSSNLLGRAREIQELEKSVRMLKQDMQRMQEEITEQRKKRQDVREAQQMLSEELQRLYLKQNTAGINLEAARTQAEQFAEQSVRLRTERAEIERQIAEITESRKAVQEELSTSETEESRLTAAVTEAAASLEDLRRKEETLRTAHGKIMLEYSSMNQRVTFLEEKITASRDEIARLAEEKASLQENMAVEHAESVEKEARIETLRQQVGTLAEAIKAAADEVETLQQKKNEMNRSHKTFFEQRDALTEERSEIEREQFRLHNRIERLNEQRDQLVSYLWEEYQISPDQAVLQPGLEETSGTELKRRSGELKKAIRDLGSININAIEEYKELKERHDFLSEQHADLIKAADALRDIIKKLDEGMRRQFRETFDLIKVEYNKVFQELFGGGKGTLELVEDEDILDAGILINAQPPGKKLQNMMQLSGGEKALSAIALLFAIQNLKPSPFCLLDEIEAALDDSNVGRYAEYLHKLTEHIQFIIITHRRGTMAAADRLYGITMQEKGVSTLVSVSLIEKDLDA